MTLADLPEHPSQWLTDTGPHSDVVISCRVRLARNLVGFPFLVRTSEIQRREIVEMTHQRIIECKLAERMLWIDLENTQELDRQLLVERHLISRQHSAASHARGVIINPDESFAIMINEEDHLRIQVLRSGMQLDDVYTHVNRIDDMLETRLDFVFSQKFGYLTACPTNVGTGIRVSAMLHLPALKMTGEIEKVKRAAKAMNLEVRGFYGEGSEALGDLYQVSNQVTLGRTENEILTDFQEVIIPQIIEYEHRARKAMAEQRESLLDDRIFRAWGTLSNARMLAGDECMHLLSLLRLGVSMGRANNLDIAVINELFLFTQPAHLQKIAKHELSGAHRREFRAHFVRQRLTEATKG